MGKYIIALDRGTTSSAQSFLTVNKNIVDIVQKNSSRSSPKPVGSNMIRWRSATASGVLVEAINRTNIPPEKSPPSRSPIKGETTILWDRKTGLPFTMPSYGNAAKYRFHLRNSEKPRLERLCAGKIPVSSSTLFFRQPGIKWIRPWGAEKRPKGRSPFGTQIPGWFWK